MIQLIDDPAIAAWAPVGTAAIGSIRLGLLDLLARPAPALREPPSVREPVAHGRLQRVSACRRVSQASELRSVLEGALQSVGPVLVEVDVA